MMFKKYSNLPTQSMLYDEHSFFKAFSADIKKTKREVIVESPYITKRRASEFSNLCSGLIKRGITIKVLTRNPNHHDGNLEIQALLGINILKEAGINVPLFDDLRHRKIAIIDNTILWEGSLNMLSHSNSKEIMRRDKSPALCSQILKVTSLNNDLRCYN